MATGVRDDVGYEYTCFMRGGVKTHVFMDDLVVERFSQSSKASRGENLQVEHPICGGDPPAFHFDPT
jgi:hypothetical protein